MRAIYKTFRFAPGKTASKGFQITVYEYSFYPTQGEIALELT